jgi:hypothetical protein
MVTLTVLTDIPFWALYNSGLRTTLVVVTEDWMMNFLGLPEMTTRLTEECWKLQDSSSIASVLLVSYTTYLIDTLLKKISEQKIGKEMKSRDPGQISVLLRRNKISQFKISSLYLGRFELSTS